MAASRAPRSTSGPALSGDLFHTTTSWPAPSSAPARAAPIRPRPSTPTCFLLSPMPIMLRAALYTGQVPTNKSGTHQKVRILHAGANLPLRIGRGHRRRRRPLEGPDPVGAARRAAAVRRAEAEGGRDQRKDADPGAAGAGSGRGRAPRGG